MKLTKKVLSLVLALSMVLAMGTVAFAARVEGDVLDGTEKITWTLSAQVFTPDTMDGVNTAVGHGAEDTAGVSITASTLKTQRADVTAYKTAQADLPYYQAGTGEEIVVNPGDMIWITTHIETNDSLYPTVLTQHWYYDPAVFVSPTMTMAQAAYIYEGTDSFDGSTDLMYQAGNAISGALWSRLHADYRTSWMQAANGLTQEQRDTYHMNNMVYLMDTDIIDGEYGGETYNNLDLDLWAIPVYVKPDATPGSTGTILMADSTQQLCQDSEGDYYETGFVIPQSGHVIDNQVLTFKVAGGEETPTVDYTALEAAITKYEGKTAADYTSTSWANATTAYEAAVAARTSTDQDTVTAAAETLEEAITALVAALDLTNWDNAVAGLPADLSGYTTSSVAAYNEAKATAEADKAAAVTAENQADLDAAAAALTAAKALLVKKADFTALDAQLNIALTTDTTGWTQASIDALDTAIATAQAFDKDDTPESAQDDVDAAEDAIYYAIVNRELAPVWAPDYTNWNAAVAKIPADLSIYTTSSVAAYEEAKAAAYEAKDAAVAVELQAGIDAAASDLEAAIASLEEKIDVAALEAKIAEIEAKNYVEEYYPEDAVVALNNALAEAAEIIAAKDDLGDQSIVEDAIDAIEAADDDMIMLDADYTVVDNAIAAIPADLSSYTDDTVNALMNAKDAVVYGLKIDQQAVVNAYAQAIVDATDALAKKAADKSALIAAIDSVANYNEADYTEATWADVVAAKEAAVAVRDNDALTVDDKATVDAATKALTDALAALEEKPKAADKDALNAAIADAKSKNLEIYTASTVATLNEALAEAEALAANDALTENDQATIDAATKALNNAITALKLKPTEGRVLEVNATDVPNAANTFAIKVEGRPVKVRFTAYNNTASTVTFNRTAAKNVGTIVSYNEAGEVVSDLSRDIAYEIWTVTFSLNDDLYYVSAKDNDGWESLSLAYVLDYQYSTDDAAVKSVEVADTAKAGDKLDVVVKTGADVLKVRTLYNGAVYQTFSNGVDDGEGGKVFNAKVGVYHAGAQTVSIEIKTANGWEAVEGFDKVVNVTL